MNEPEVIPPEPKEKDKGKIVLLTAGQVAAEIARVYRQVRRGKIPITDGTRLTYILRNLLEAKKVELAFSLASEDPDSDRPALVGLTIKGPSPDLPANTPARQMNQSEIVKLETEYHQKQKKKGKADDEKNKDK